MECDGVQMESCFARLRTCYSCFGFKKAYILKLLPECYSFLQLAKGKQLMELERANVTCD